MRRMWSLGCRSSAAGSRDYCAFIVQWCAMYRVGRGLSGLILSDLYFILCLLKYLPLICKYASPAVTWMSLRVVWCICLCQVLTYTHTVPVYVPSTECSTVAGSRRWRYSRRYTACVIVSNVLYNILRKNLFVKLESLYVTRVENARGCVVYGQHCTWRVTRAAPWEQYSALTSKRSWFLWEGRAVSAWYLSEM